MGCRDESIGRRNSGEYNELDQAVTVGVVVGCMKNQATSANEVAGVMVEARCMSMKNQAASADGSDGAVVEAGYITDPYGAATLGIG